MEYELRMTEAGEAEFVSLPVRAQAGLLKKMEALRADPRLAGKPLRGGLQGSYRLRFSDWRIVYQVAEEERVVYIVGAGHRKNVYD